MYILLKIGIFQCHVGFQGCTLEDQIQMGTETFWNVALGTRIMAEIDEICRFKWRYVPKTWWNGRFGTKSATNSGGDRRIPRQPIGWDLPIFFEMTWQYVNVAPEQ